MVAIQCKYHSVCGGFPVGVVSIVLSGHGVKQHLLISTALCHTPLM